MIRYLFILLIVIGYSQLAIAQYPDIVKDDTVTVYPVRINHKVGFVEIFPNNKAYEYIPPIYDFIAEVNATWHTPQVKRKLSPYRLFERDEKVGLLDDALHTVLPNRYKRIRVLGPNFFAVEQDSLFQLIDSTEALFLNGQHFDDIYLADEIPGKGRYFFVKRQNRWGLCRQDGKMLLTPQFIEMQQAGVEGFYKVRRTSQKKEWWLIDSTGQKILPTASEDILVLSETFIAIQQDLFWYTLFLNPQTGDQKINETGYLYLEKINKNLAAFALLGTPEVELWRIDQKKVIKHYKRETRVAKKGAYFKVHRNDVQWFPWWFPLDDDYVIFNKASTPTQETDLLMDIDGNVKSPAFEYILPSGKPKIYRVSQKDNWGLYTPTLNDGALIPCDYTHINPFVGDIAFCQSGRRSNDQFYGAISMQNNVFDVLIPNYKKIEQQDDQSVRVADKSNEVVFKINEAGKFQIDTIFENTLSISLNKNKNRREVKIIPKIGTPDYATPTEKKGQFTTKKQKTGFAIVKLAPPQSGIGAAEEIPLPVSPLPYIPPSIFQIIPNEILAIYQKHKPVYSSFVKTVLENPILPIGLLSIEQDKFVEETPIIGIRPFDKTYAHTAFLRTDGQMGLIDRKGNTLKRNGHQLLFTYIGPFRADRARVCIGGELKAIEDTAGKTLEEPPLFMLGKRADFMREFQMMLAQNKPTGRNGEPYLFVSSKNSPAKWGFINTEGELVLEPDADFVFDFDWQDKSALILKKNGRPDLYGHPDADFGVINYEGIQIVPTQYDEIQAYADYFIIGKRGTPTFTFNKKGHQIFVNPSKPSPFSEGYALFRNEENLWGYIDTTGNIVIPPRYRVARPFAEGLAMVVDSTEHCVFINTKGEKVITTPVNGRLWPFVGDFHDGVCWWTTNNKKWHCYNKAGELAFPMPALYEYKKLSNNKAAPFTHFTLHPLPMDFSAGVAVIAVPDSLTGKPSIAAINKSGDFIIPTGIVESLSAFNTLGVAVFTKVEGGGLQGLLDRHGTILLAPQFQDIGPFQDGYAKVKHTNGKYGLIDQFGQEALPSTYTKIGPISEGLVAVQATARPDWQFIHIQTQRPIGGTFDKIQAFKGGVTFVSKKEERKIINSLGEEIQLKSGAPKFFSEGIFGVEGGYGKETSFYADASGNNLFGQEYTEIDTFHLGIAKVRPTNVKNRLYGAINNRGVYIVPPKFRYLHPQPDGNIIINPQLFYGLINKKGAILLAPAFDRIEQLQTPNLFRAERGEMIGYFRVIEDKIKWIWELQN